jgi:hypothetical protein
MISLFQDLSEKDQSILTDAPLLVAIWVGIADNHFDKNEQVKAVKTLSIKSFSESPDIAVVYQGITDPASRLTSIINSMPSDVESMKIAVKNRLLEVKEVLQKMENAYALQLFRSFRNVGVHVANASGGMLGLGSMAADEKIALELDFLKP